MYMCRLTSSKSTHIVGTGFPDRAQAHKGKENLRGHVAGAELHLLLFLLPMLGNSPGQESKAGAMLGTRSSSQMGRQESRVGREKRGIQRSAPARSKNWI